MSLRTRALKTQRSKDAAVTESEEADTPPVFPPLTRQQQQQRVWTHGGAAMARASVQHSTSIASRQALMGSTLSSSTKATLRHQVGSRGIWDKRHGMQSGNSTDVRPIKLLQLSLQLS